MVKSFLTDQLIVQSISLLFQGFQDVQNSNVIFHKTKKYPIVSHKALLNVFNLHMTLHPP